MPGAVSYILGQQLGVKSRESSIRADRHVAAHPASDYRGVDSPGRQSAAPLDVRSMISASASGWPRSRGTFGTYDRIIIDWPPGSPDTSDQILRASELVVVPVNPSLCPSDRSM